VGTWDIGPFDSDNAADWSFDLDEAEPGDRVDLIRRTLLKAADEAGYLDSTEGSEAIAAAAVVAAQLPGAAPLTTPYAPDFLVEGGRVALAPELPALAVRALERVMGPDSEWCELWGEAFEPEKAYDVVRDLRRVLAGS
jgi:hypothetical protein